MELLITLGRDCVVACQNEASAKLKTLPLRHVYNPGHIFVAQLNIRFKFIH